MRIFVVGNINAGKSYVANKLKQLFPTYHILAIDTYRKSLSDGTLSKELMVRKQFAQDILKYPDAIIEFSGGTTITDYFIDAIEKNSFIIIEVQAPLKLCLQRIKDKRFSETPYPKFNETIEETIIRLHKLFNEGLINQSFKHKFLHKFVISSQDDITKLPLYQYQNALTIRNLFKGRCQALIAYGSLGRHDLNRLSDIDLFLLT